jgi:tetratricopeptide (TPR) repeat protein
MIRLFAIATLLVIFLGASRAAQPPAQNPSGADAAANGSKKPADDAQEPPATVPQSSANPFPEDTSSVPVMPTKDTPAAPGGSSDGTGAPAYNSFLLPSDDTDPVRCPDDPAPSTAEDEESSSSLKNVESILPPPDTEETQERHKKLSVTKQPSHQEVAKSDIDIGSYYLDRKNWRAALSRYESAMVLDPENPDVYWGLAEAERNLGQFAKAREHYGKLLDYDPEGKHAKQARKALKDPALADVRVPASGQSATVAP